MTEAITITHPLESLRFAFSPSSSSPLLILLISQFVFALSVDGIKTFGYELHTFMCVEFFILGDFILLLWHFEVTTTYGYALNSLPDRSLKKKKQLNSFDCVSAEVSRSGHTHHDLGIEEFIVFAINKIVLISMYAILFSA